MSVYGSILDATVTTIGNLGIQYNSVAVPVVLRKLPKAEEVLDALPLICVSPSVSAMRWERVAFPALQQVGYPVQVGIIAASNRDFTSNIDLLLGWAEQIRSAFKKPPLAGVSQVWKTEVSPGKVFDRSLLVGSDYDYLALDIVFTTLE